MEIGATLLTVAYAAAALGFFLLAALVLARPIRSDIGKVFLACALISALVQSLFALANWFPQIIVLRVFTSLPMVAWCGFLIFWIRKIGVSRFALPLLATLLGLWATELAALFGIITISAPTYYTVRVMIGLLTLISAEQLLRNAPDTLRWSVKHLILGIGACAAFDVVYFGQAMVTGRPETLMSIARGVLWAFAAPLLAISAARNPSWALPIHVSRNLVFHTLTTLLVGAFLVLIGLLGYIVSKLGFAWASVLQMTFSIAALLFGATLFMSQSFRARIRSFIDRNFYNYRYDYRKEWLGFTQALSQRSADSVYKTINAAFGALLDSPAAAIYARNSSGAMQLRFSDGLGKPPETLSISALNTNGPFELLDKTVPAAQYLATQFDIGAGSLARVAVPLMGPTEIHGLVLLAAPRSGHALDREVLDLLAVASNQASSLLLQYESAEELLVARQFDAFNKMSAFVVHDLKNLVAQLSLLTANAEHHRDNPEFQADMIDTVRHVTGRMKLLLEQLANGATANPAELVNVVDCLKLAIASKPGLKTKPETRLATEQPALTLAHVDRLSRIFGHLVQNADEALRDTKAPEIVIEVSDRDANIVVAVSDNGPGMSDIFVKEKLFRPFTSTKQTGMGIGVFESANYLKEIGGAISVKSALGVGTRFEVCLARTQPT
jgi:putative PEP-CTERM system histidine kinase